MRRVLFAVGLACQVWVLGPVSATEWQFLDRVEGAQYTYDLATTNIAVYLVLGDSLHNPMGLYRYVFATEEMEFVGNPGGRLDGVHVAGDSDEHIWLGAESSAPDDVAVWHSSDGGESWEPQLNGWLGGLYALSGSSDGDYVYAASHSVLCLKASSNGGKTWTSWGGCTNALYGARGIETDRVNPRRAYCSIVFYSWGSTYVVETDDGGLSWEVVLDDSNEPAFGSIYPSASTEGDFAFVDDGGQIYIRKSGEWGTIQDTNLRVVFGFGQPLWDEGAWWIAGKMLYDTLKVGRFNGLYWQDWDDGLPTVILDSPAFHGARLWPSPTSGDVFLSMYDQGLWKYPAPLSWAPENDVVGVSLQLVLPPWPNPTSGSVTLALRGEPAEIRVQVLDSAGRLVRALHGRSPLVWDGRLARGSEAPAGVYFMKVMHGEGVTTRKVQIIR